MNGDVISRFRAACVGAGVAMILLLVIASGALAASSVSLCVSSKQGEAVTSGECPANKKNVTYTPVALPSEPAAQQTLISILPYIKFAQDGVGGKPTIQVTGANLQVVSGSGKTNGPVNGAGNLIIGYDEEANCMEIMFCGKGLPPQTGSHNLVLGSSQEYTSFGAILGGIANTASARSVFVVGIENTSSGIGSSVSGGAHGKASGGFASISGGGTNTASGERASVSGGRENSATEAGASVSGGGLNTAEGLNSSVVGGTRNRTDGPGSAILGGSRNTANGEDSSIGAGRANTTGGVAENAAILGGIENEASGQLSSVSGGQLNTASGKASSILGGTGIAVACEFCHSP